MKKPVCTILIVFLPLTACLGQPAIFGLSEIDVDEFQGPMVLASDPPAGSYGIPTDYPVSITFNEAVRSDTILTSLGVHGLEGTDFPVEATLSQDLKTLRITGQFPAREPVQILLRATLLNGRGLALRDQDPFDDQPFTPYALTITIGTGRIAGPARVVSTDPAEGKNDVSPLALLRVVFGKRMNPAGLRVSLAGPAGEESAELLWENDTTELTVRPQKSLRPGSRYTLTIPPFADHWGVPMQEGVALGFVTQKAGGHIVINEVVTDPKRDWNDTAGGDADLFGPLAGTGSITTSDEWVELYNGSPLAVDLTGWTLVMTDGSDQTHVLGGSPYVTERFSDSASALVNFAPGAYLVIGNPVGDMLNDVTLALRDAAGFEQDRVQLGGGHAPTGFSNAITDEAVVRRPNGADTDADGFDWARAGATPGSAN